MENIEENLCDVCNFDTKYCICQDFWKDFGLYFISDTKYSFGTPSPLVVSTMTVNFSINNIHIDLIKLSEQFQVSMFTRHLKFRTKSKKSKVDGLSNFNFYNQASMTSYIPKTDNLTDNELIKVSTKIFHNGSFTLTGVKNIHNAVYMIRTVLSLLLSYKDVIITNGKMYIANVRVSMINSDFCVSRKINQRIFNNIMKEYIPLEMIRTTSYNPDNYHAVKISYLHQGYNKDKKFTRKGVEKCKGEVTISVFNSGHIIITGGETPVETMGAYQFINSVFEKHQTDIFRTGTIIKKKRKVYLRQDIKREISMEIYNSLKTQHLEKFKQVLDQLS